MPSPDTLCHGPRANQADLRACGSAIPRADRETLAPVAPAGASSPGRDDLDATVRRSALGGEA
jgi:hypothetical protein